MQSLRTMTKNSKISLISIGACILVGFVAMVIHNYNSKTSLKNEEETTQVAEIKSAEATPQDTVNAGANTEEFAETRVNSEILKVSGLDIVYGDKSAPVTFIEYSSLSCPHCASFNRETFERIKSDYIDSKKVKFIHRDFPLNQPALAASMFALCQAQDQKNEMVEKYYGLIKALFKTQESWAFDPKYIEKLQSIAQLDGMSPDRFNKCINDQDLQKKILELRIEAAKGLNIKSTPTFFVNGEVSEGYVDYVTIKKLIDKKLSEIK